MRPLALALLLACRPDAAEPTATPATPPAGAPATTPTAGTAAPATDVIDGDLDVMIGGNFSPDHLGPQAYDELLARALAHADAYAQRLSSRHAERARSEPVYADLHVAAALAVLSPRAPERAASSARTLHDAFFVLLQQPALDERQRRRIREQTATLKVLAGAIDRPTAAGATAVRPDRVCAVATPGGHGLLAERDCTCGEPLACRVVRRGDALELTLEQLPGPAICDDCYPGWTTCTVDRLAAGECVRVISGPAPLGELTAGAGGWLPVGTCLQ